LTWKNRISFFQRHRGNQEKEKAGFDVCQADCRENKLDRLPRDLERAKAKF